MGSLLNCILVKCYNTYLQRLGQVQLQWFLQWFLLKYYLVSHANNFFFVSTLSLFLWLGRNDDGYIIPPKTNDNDKQRSWLTHQHHHQMNESMRTMVHTMRKRCHPRRYHNKRKRRYTMRKRCHLEDITYNKRKQHDKWWWRWHTRAWEHRRWMPPEDDDSRIIKEMPLEGDDSRIIE